MHEQPVLEDAAVAPAARHEELIARGKAAVGRAILAVPVPHLRARLRMRGKGCAGSVRLARVPGTLPRSETLHCPRFSH